MLPSKELCCLCRRALSSVLPDFFLWAADFSRPFASSLRCCQKWLTLELVCVCFFEKKPLLFSVFSVTCITTVWWMAALLSTRCAPCSFSLTCRRSRTLPPAWGGMTSTSASAQVFTQHCKRIAVQRLPFRVCAVVEFCVYLRCLQDKTKKERNVFCSTGKLCGVMLFHSLKLLSVCPHLEMVCDPLGDFNVWASTRPINNTAKGHKMWESVVIAAARVSPSIRAFLPYMSKSDRLEVSQRCTTVTLVLFIREWVSQRKTFSMHLPWWCYSARQCFTRKAKP